MATTFKFGNKNWATKEGSVLAYNDENNNFKPLPFTFTRSSTATRVNKDGLIEVVGIDEPRVDYLNNADGHLLLEPSRTNIVTYSEDGSNWDFIQATITSTTDSTSPSGQSSVYKVNDNTVDGQHRADVRPSVTNGTEYTFSVFVKKESNSDIDFIYLLLSSNFDTARYFFNIEEGTSLDSGGTIEDYGNGWYRCSITATATSTGNGIFGVNLSNANNNNTYQGTGNGSMFVWGFQVEEGSYATSYIPTSGSSETRAAEDAANGGNSQVFDNDSAVWFIDCERIGIAGGSAISLQNSSGGEQLRYHFDDPSELCRFRDALSSYATIGNYISFGTNVRKKFALRIDGSTVSVFANGSKEGNDYTRPTAFDIHKIQIYYRAFKLYDMKFYNTALTDSELIALTS